MLAYALPLCTAYPNKPYSHLIMINTLSFFYSIFKEQMCPFLGSFDFVLCDSAMSL
jgi:hypothetical protein